MKNRLFALLTLACVPNAIGTARGSDVCLEAHLTAFDGEAFQNFGRAVAVSDVRVMVGAMFDDQGGPNSGAVYAYQRGRASEPWVFEQKLRPLDLGANDQFGHALAVHDQLVFIAAPGHIHDSGRGTVVYVFGFDPASLTWMEEQELCASDGVADDFFGVSLDVTDDVAIVGASFDDDNGAQSGSAYVFRYDSRTARWVEEQKLVASNGMPADFFGESVTIAGDVALVGAPNADAVYAFRFDRAINEWVEEPQRLTASDGIDGSEFGSDVSVSANTALIGARDDGSGSAYVFEFDRISGLWQEQEKLIPTDVEGTLLFGDAVALHHDMAVIGAWKWSREPGRLDFGSAYLFRRDGERWEEQDQVFGNESTFFFGRSVAIEGDIVVVGANGENAQAGAAYVFDVSLNCDCPSDTNADGSVDVQDLVEVILAWGTDDPASDINDDGIVDVLDLIEVIVAWGPCGS